MSILPQGKGRGGENPAGERGIFGEREECKIPLAKKGVFGYDILLEKTRRTFSQRPQKGWESMGKRAYLVLKRKGGIMKKKIYLRGKKKS